MEGYVHPAESLYHMKYLCQCPQMILKKADGRKCIVFRTSIIALCVN